jgi:molybdenum cofactor cytidylyltransferase
VAVEGCLQGYVVEVVFNPRWEAGVATSLAVGIEAIRLRDASGVLVMLCDQPMLQVKDMARLAAIWRAAADIPAAARYAGVLGAPAIFPSGYFACLAGLQGDLGARALLRDQDCCSILDIPEAAFDVDTTADVDRLRRYDY